MTAAILAFSALALINARPGGGSAGPEKRCGVCRITVKEPPGCRQWRTVQPFLNESGAHSGYRPGRVAAYFRSGRAEVEISVPTDASSGSGTTVAAPPETAAAPPDTEGIPEVPPLVSRRPRPPNRRPGCRNPSCAESGREGPSNTPIDYTKVKIQVFFYDMVDNKDIKLTDADVSYEWLTPHHNWADTNPEILAVTYLRTKRDALSSEAALSAAAAAVTPSGGKKSRSRSESPALRDPSTHLASGNFSAISCASITRINFKPCRARTSC